MSVEGIEGPGGRRLPTARPLSPTSLTHPESGLWIPDNQHRLCIESQTSSQRVALAHDGLDRPHALLCMAFDGLNSTSHSQSRRRSSDPQNPLSQTPEPLVPSSVLWSSSQSRAIQRGMNPVSLPPRDPIVSACASVKPVSRYHAPGVSGSSGSRWAHDPRPGRPGRSMNLARNGRCSGALPPVGVWLAPVPRRRYAEAIRDTRYTVCAAQFSFRDSAASGF